MPEPSDEALDRVHRMNMKMGMTPADIEFQLQVNMALVADPDVLVKVHAAEVYCAALMLAEAMRISQHSWQDWMVSLPGIAEALREAADVFERIAKERTQ